MICPIHNIEGKPSKFKEGEYWHKDENMVKACVFTAPETGQQAVAPVSPSVTKPVLAGGLTSEEINRGLKTLPSLIANASERYYEALEEEEKTKLNLKVEQAKALISHSREDITNPEKQAKVQEETMGFDIELIEKETASRKAKLEVEKLTNSFDAVRKAANILVAEMSHIGD